MKLCLRILQWFYEISGLKINIKKTKVIRIGNIRETYRRYCKENNLDWVTSLVALGITYDVLDMHNLTKINIKEKLPQIMHLTQSWSKRNITPNGRITVLKSLILSKITHILISLPAATRKCSKNLKRCVLILYGKEGDMRFQKTHCIKPLSKEDLI